MENEIEQANIELAERLDTVHEDEKPTETIVKKGSKQAVINEIFDLCKKQISVVWTSHIKQNVQMKPHFDKNVGLPAICFFSPHGTFRGGGLATEAHHFVQPGVWHS